MLLGNAVDTSKDSGPDGVSSQMIKATAHSIAPSLTKLFNISITTGKIPGKWKLSAVVPIRVALVTQRNIDPYHFYQWSVKTHS